MTEFLWLLRWEEEEEAGWFDEEKSLEGDVTDRRDVLLGPEER